MPGAARGELPAVDLAAVPGVEHQDDELALVDGLEHPIVADPDAQHAVGTCDHLRSGRARIGSQGLDCLSDPAAYRLVQGQERLPGAGATRSGTSPRLQPGLGLDLLPRNGLTRLS